MALYGGNIETHYLDVIRYEQYLRKIASVKNKEIDIAHLPKTRNASKYHSLRVFLQCFIWRNKTKYVNY